MISDHVKLYNDYNSYHEILGFPFIIFIDLKMKLNVSKYMYQ